MERGHPPRSQSLGAPSAATSLPEALRLSSFPRPDGAYSLFLRLSSLGDLVLCSALVEEVAAREPGKRLVFAADERFAPLLASFPVPVEALALKRPRLGLFGWLLTGWRVGRELGAPSAVFDLHGVGKTSFFRLGLRLSLLGTGAKWRTVATPKFSLRRSLSILLGRDLVGPRHVFRDHLALADRALAPAGERRERRPSLKVPAASDARDPRALLAAPDASYWKKKWPADSWRRLLEGVLRDPAGYTVTLVGGARALPQDVVDELEAIGGARVRNLLGRTSLAELPALAASHAVCVCGNSAWLHIAEAVGTPVVALAGPIVPGFGFSPWRPASVELSVPLDCRPCSKHGGGICYRRGDEFHACMRGITPDRVWEAARASLGDSP